MSNGNYRCVIGAPGKERLEHVNDAVRATWAAEDDLFWWSAHPVLIWLGLMWQRSKDAGAHRKTPVRDESLAESSSVRIQHIGPAGPENKIL